MASVAPAESVRRDTEGWLVHHGLPYFVDDVRADVRAGLGRARLVRVGLLILLAGAVAGVAVGLWRYQGSEQRGGAVASGLTAGTQLIVLLALVYAATTLRAWSIARWALRRTRSELRLLFPLVTRALPLLLLFVTFLFINAEVWQVASTLRGAVMWLTVLLFTAITVGFLLVRLPEELAAVGQDLAPGAVVDGCAGTPVADYARACHEAGEELPVDTGSGLERANLVLMLLIAQLVQVLLLSFAVFCFFVFFGLLIMDPGIVVSWTGQETVSAVLPWFERLNWELLRVSVFLAAFSGLYFTVYAVTDEVYRKQFFTVVLVELARALTVRAAYRHLADPAEPD